MDTYIQNYLDGLEDPKQLVNKYVEIHNKTLNKKLLKEDIVNCILQYISNNKNKDYKLLSLYVDKALRFKHTDFQKTILNT
jgi:hypothetical protein